jgi:hypothetical protein
MHLKICVNLLHPPNLRSYQGSRVHERQLKQPLRPSPSLSALTYEPPYMLHLPKADKKINY